MTRMLFPRGDGDTQLFAYLFGKIGIYVFVAGYRRGHGRVCAPPNIMGTAPVMKHAAVIPQVALKLFPVHGAMLSPTVADSVSP